MNNIRYSKRVMQHFLHPRNIGNIKNADGVGKVGNPICGDILILYIKVGKRKEENKEKEIEYIKDIKFQTLGCAAAIAVSSMITELAKGKTLKEAEKITNKNIIHELGFLPRTKYHCSLLGEEALKKAIEDYRTKRKERKNKIQKKRKQEEKQRKEKKEK